MTSQDFHEPFRDSNPSRPPLNMQKSYSLPSTPRQRARSETFEEPATALSTGNATPTPFTLEANERHYSNSRFSVQCKFKSLGNSFARRMAYTDDLTLPKPIKHVSADIHVSVESRLIQDIDALMSNLEPPSNDEEKREQLVNKLESTIRKYWDDDTIHLKMFGSSANGLCAYDSDVDICILMNQTKPWCALANLLFREGFHEIQCIHAKVPIVRLVDPETKLSCDLNVNNTSALKNTILVKSYMSLNSTARQAAMAIKYWTRRRCLNQALAGCLTSYTWTIMIIFWLQKAMLPCLTFQDNDDPCDLIVDVPTEISVNQLHWTVSSLLYGFFHFYGFEFDFYNQIASVRDKTCYFKTERGWEGMQSQFCIEDPMNPTKNLAATADGAATKGIVQELRKACTELQSGRRFSSQVCGKYTPVTRRALDGRFTKPPTRSQRIPIRSQSQSEAEQTDILGSQSSTRIRNSSHQYMPWRQERSRRASGPAHYSQERLFPPLTHPTTLNPDLTPQAFALNSPEFGHHGHHGHHRTSTMPILSQLQPQQQHFQDWIPRPLPNGMLAHTQQCSSKKGTQLQRPPLDSTDSFSKQTMVAAQ